MAEKALELKNVSVIKSGTKILDKVTMDIEEGENIAIIGLNGSGKTTLLKLLRGDTYPYYDEEDPYEMRIFGEKHWNIFELRNRMGVVSMDLQSQFASTTTVREVIGSGIFGSLDVFKGMEITPAFKMLIEMRAQEMGVDYLLDRTVEGLSLGEMRRTLIARALVSNPRMLILDEPMTGLDIVMKSKFRKMFDLLIQTGVAIVMITHELDDIPTKVNRVIMIRDGKIVGDGAKEELLTNEKVSALYGEDIVVESTNGIYRMHLHSNKSNCNVGEGNPPLSQILII